MNPLLRLPAVRDNAAMETEPSKSDPPKRKRRWFQFSLRTLLIFTVVCAIGAAWVATRMEQKRRELNAVETVVRLGGCANFSDDCYDDGLLHMSPAEYEPPGLLTRLLRVAGLDSDFHVVHVHFRGGTERTSVKDSDLTMLTAFPHLLDLELSDVEIGDDGLRYAAALTELRNLDLRRTRVTDAGLRYLAELKELKSIDLDGTHVTSQGIERLQQTLPKAEIINPTADWLKFMESVDNIMKDKSSGGGASGPNNSRGQ
jgi:hypothetical protein